MADKRKDGLSAPKPPGPTCQPASRFRHCSNLTQTPSSPPPRLLHSLPTFLSHQANTQREESDRIGSHPTPPRAAAAAAAASSSRILRRGNHLLPAPAFPPPPLSLYPLRRRHLSRSRRGFLRGKPPPRPLPWGNQCGAEANPVGGSVRCSWLAEMGNRVVLLRLVYAFAFKGDA